jgi:SAM-dependent methyltransferase
MDVSQSTATSVVGDAQCLPFADTSFDTVFCSQVLEHVPEPWLCLSEFRRVLKPGGTLILSVPHISWLHNEPHDYYRYTKHGLRFLLEQSELPLLRVEPAGGILALLGHIVSTIMINSTFGLPILHKMAFVVNSCFVKGVFGLDKFVEQKKIFALNYVAVSQKTTDRDPNGK